MTPRRLAPLRVKAPLWASRLGGALMPWACARTSYPSQETGRLDALSVCNYVGCFWHVNVISYWHLWFKLYNLFPSSKELVNFSCQFSTFIYLHYSRLVTFVALLTKLKNAHLICILHTQVSFHAYVSIWKTLIGFSCTLALNSFIYYYFLWRSLIFVNIDTLTEHFMWRCKLVSAHTSSVDCPKLIRVDNSYK